MADFLLKLTDEVPIKSDSSVSPQNLLVSAILQYAIDNNLGNAFMLIDVGNSKAGCNIRYFNITGDTAYVATTSYLNYYNNIGIYAPNNAITTISALQYWTVNTSGRIGPRNASANFLELTVDNITYSCTGGNISGYASSQAIYIPDSITNIYIDGSPLVTYEWTSVPAISGKNGILSPLSTLNDVNNGEEITTSDTIKFNLTEASNVAKLVSNIINAQG